MRRGRVCPAGLIIFSFGVADHEDEHRGATSSEVTSQQASPAEGAGATGHDILSSEGPGPEMARARPRLGAPSKGTDRDQPPLSSITHGPGDMMRGTTGGSGGAGPQGEVR